MKEYTTNYVPLAVCLRIRGTPLKDIEYSEDGYATFVFPDTEKVQSIVKDFYDEKLEIEPNAFINEHKLIMGRVKRKHKTMRNIGGYDDTY